jgi:hypothetical protein
MRQMTEAGSLKNFPQLVQNGGKSRLNQHFLSKNSNKTVIIFDFAIALSTLLCYNTDNRKN